MRPSNKNWASDFRADDFRSESSWRIFRIMSEFVEGFDKMNNIGPCVSVYGSARTKPDHPHYKMAEDLAKLLVESGFGVITGGGPGVMEAANKGAQEAGGKSVGLGITLPHEQSVNKYVDYDKTLIHHYFFVRKVMFVKYGQAFVFLPGGYGTLDELFECITLIQTKKIAKVPIVLIGTEFWTGLIDWIKNTVLAAGNISPKDLDLIPITDDLDKAVEFINMFYDRAKLQPNF